MEDYFAEKEIGQPVGRFHFYNEGEKREESPSSLVDPGEKDGRGGNRVTKNENEPLEEGEEEKRAERRTD